MPPPAPTWEEYTYAGNDVFLSVGFTDRLVSVVIVIDWSKNGGPLISQ
jgi:hypothetical protein